MLLDGVEVSLTFCATAANLNDCRSYRAAAAACFIVFTTSTLFLSYIRVCAVWNRSKTVILIFGMLWLASLASSLTTVRGLTILRLEQLCLPETAGDFVAAAVVVPTINHVFVFSTITYGLCRTRSQPSLLDFRKGYRLYILGDTLPDFSKALLQSSQLCYLYVSWYFHCRTNLINNWHFFKASWYWWEYWHWGGSLATVLTRPIV